MSTHTEQGEVVVGIDVSKSGRTALRWAADYARVTGSRLRAVYVFSTDAGTPTSWAPGGFPALAYPIAAETREMMRAELQGLFDSLPPQPGWELEVCDGSAGRTLVDRAQNAELLVVGTREHTGVDRILHGSVSHYCLSHAQCPVMAVPPSQPELQNSPQPTATVSVAPSR